ncbi:MAG TPA: SapC family protein [Steroidobacteraceae bacterium]|nr:SapC family protein [Steroidobacteraceae bacterium]
MPKHVMLNNVAHKDLRVIRRFGAQFGDNVPTVLTFPTEFADVQREYPIFFRKDPATNEYQSVALLGFEKNENLFLEGDMWRANYIPGVIARGPFLIGFQDQEIDGEVRKEPVIHVDMEHPRVSRTEGEPVFLPQGGNSPYLDYIANVLRGIRDGIEVSKAMFAAFLEFELIEPVKVEIKLNENEGYSLVGLETINQTKLAALDGAALEKLNKAGFLQGAFLVAASLSNVQRLMAIKQRKRQSA